MKYPDDELVTGHAYGTLGRDEDYESGFAFTDARQEFAREIGSDATLEGGELRFDPLFEGSRVVGVLASLSTEPGALSPFICAAERGRGFGALALEHLDDLDADLLALPGSPLEAYATMRGFTSPKSTGRLVRLAPPRRARRAIHGASTALVCPSTYSVLLGRRMGEPLKGYLAFPGGKVEPGESALTAARRELFEEVGLRADCAPSLETRVYGGAGDGTVFALDCFVIRVDEPMRPVASAEMEASWVHVDEAPKLRPMAPGTQRVLRRLRRAFSSLSRETDPEVSYRLVMGSANEGSWQKGTVADLYARFFDPVARFVPPLGPLNDKLRSGIHRAGEHGIHLRWQPLELTPLQYEGFCKRLMGISGSGGRRYSLIGGPEHLQSWDDWSRWAYETQVEPTLRLEAERARGARDAELETDLKRRYRRALAQGDAAEAEALAERIRKNHDPSFS